MQPIRTTHPGPTAIRSPAHVGLIPRAARPTGRFALHLLEMCVVMCASGIALSVLFFQAAALLGYTNLTQTAPELSVLVIAFNLSVPMALWMRYRGMDWRPTLEMAGATVATGLLLIGAYRSGLLAQSRLVEVQTGLACPVMIAVMLARFRLYAAHGRHASHVA